MKIVVLLICCTFAFAKNKGDDEHPIVETPSGAFRGSIMKSQLGRQFYAFRGIRYAMAPTGYQRFKKARISPTHEGIFNATQDGPSCPQPVTDNRIISEDCLSLNVYTNSLPQNSSDDPSVNELDRPVIVLFHPGAFYSSSGSSYDLGPQLVLDSDLVFVVPNYRLGALGFLSTGDSRAPGNAGLKDQVLVLHWIQKNIRAFGGNPKSVTISGHGAGAMSVTLHMVSPMSRGLFHRAITMSGAATVHKPLPTDQLDLANKQARLLGCPTDKLNDMLNCFYYRKPEDYAKSLSQFDEIHYYPALIYTPVVEPEDSDEERFLPAQPVDIIRQGKANFVPLYTGINKDEFSQVVKPTVEQVMNESISFSREFNKIWVQVSPLNFASESKPASMVSMKRKFYHFYYKDRPTGLQMYQKLAQFYADAFTIFPMHRFERLMATYSPEKVYFYHDIYVGCDTYGEWWNGTDFGVAHADELLLGYRIGGRPAHCQRDVMVAGQIMVLLMNFANTGEPMPGDFPKIFGCDWKPSTKDHPQYMEFGIGGLRMVPGFVYQERMNRWDQVFPLSLTGN